MAPLVRVTLAALAAVGAAGQTAYFISSSRGDDGNAGTSPAQPWKTLAAAAKVAPGLGPGSQILLSAGDTFNQTGAWYLAGMRGTAASPVRISWYSPTGATLERPRIVRAEAAPPGPTLTVADSAGVEVTGLEIVGGENGIAFSFSPPAGAPAPTVFDWLVVEDCWIHGVRQLGFNSSADSASSAIAMAASSNGSTAIATRVRLAHNLITDSDKAWSTSFPYPGWRRVYASQVLLLANFLTGVRFNSVFLDSTDHVLLSGNVMLRDKPDELFLYGTTDIIIGTLNGSNSIVGNEIGYRGEYTGQPQDGPDGCAIDFETSASGMSVINNFVHHAWGAGIMVLGHQTTSTDLVIAGNTLLYNGCNQTRDDRGGMSFLHPNSSGVITGNTFATCPGTPLFYALDNATLDNWRIVGNVVDGEGGAVVAPMPPPTVAWAPAADGLTSVATAAAAPVGGGITQRLVYTLDGSRPTAASQPWPASGSLPLGPRATGLLVKAFATSPPPGGVSYVESPSAGGVVVPGSSSSAGPGAGSRR